MSQEPNTTGDPAKAPKKKAGFWGWLTGGSEPEAAAGAGPVETPPAAMPAPEAPEPVEAPETAATLAPGPHTEATPATEASDAASAVPPAPEAFAIPVVTPAPAEPEVPAEPEIMAPAAAPLVAPPLSAGAGALPAPAPQEAPTAPASARDGGAPGDTPPEAGEISVSEIPVAEPAPSPLPGADAIAQATPEASATADPEAPAAAETPAPAPAEPSPETAPETIALAAEAAQPPPAEPAPLAKPAPLPEAVAATPQEPKQGFWSRLASGLARTATGLTQGITDLVTKRKLDADTLEELEDLLIRADLGTDTALRIVEAVGKGRHDKMIAPEEVKSLIAAEVEAILSPVAKPLVVDSACKPFVVLMVGVNGSGKTTTIGKLAAQWRAEGRKVVLAAGDTFRAAAIEQLKVWGARTGATVIARESGADAAGVAHDGYTTARAEGADILMIDTAGRLQNRAELMAELEKVVRVIRKLEPAAPHAVLLVLDATVGQNALSQVEAFSRTAGVTGLVMTKLDGTARGGILVAIAAKHHLPIHLIGVGEGADDLQPFTARDFARAIAGLA